MTSARQPHDNPAAGVSASQVSTVDHDGGGDHAGMAADEERFDLELEMAPTLRRIARKSGEVALMIVAVDRQGPPCLRRASICKRSML
jgi:hypothetical protein